MIVASLVVGAATLPAIVPQPVSVQMAPGSFALTSQSKIVVSRETAKLGETLREYLVPATGLSLPIVRKSSGDSIYLRIDKGMKELGDEGYRLNVSESKIEITASNPAGAFYGIQTLRQLLPVSVYGNVKSSDTNWVVPCVSIQDQPRFAWRGALLDVGRHFMPKEFVLKFIDLLALHKMNVLHWHLTEDQGWRIEIKKYPKLTSVGAWRKDSMLTYSPATYTGLPHGGFYTQDDIREVVRYAAKRFVTVVPEIEMPGHCQAALAAYPELGNTDQHLEVSTKWGVNENVYNPKDSTIQFLQDVLSEVLGLFPSKFVHIGGDEVPKTQWHESADAQALMKQRDLKNEHELQSWFVHQMDTYLANHGRRLIGWDEILEGGLAPGATVMSWRGEDGGIAAAKAGHDVVMTPGNWTYFDHYPTRNIQDEPHAIGGYLPLQKVYEYEPVPASLTSEEARHILGVQGQLWTEYIPTPERVEYMAFPRMCALAEVIWSPKDSKNYTDFRRRLDVQMERLRVLNVHYRTPKDSD